MITKDAKISNALIANVFLNPTPPKFSKKRRNVFPFFRTYSIFLLYSTCMHWKSYMFTVLSVWGNNVLLRFQLRRRRLQKHRTTHRVWFRLFATVMWLRPNASLVVYIWQTCCLRLAASQLVATSPESVGQPHVHCFLMNKCTRPQQRE